VNKSSPWAIFCLVAVAQFMVVLDVCVTNVALPAIGTSLQFDSHTLQWVVTAYALTFGGFLLLGGRASDIFGHRRVLLAGLGAFTLLSLLIGLSQTPTMLIVLRALQGMAAAFMSPAALSVVLITFSEGKERNRALGHWTTVSTGGAAAGLLLGGILTQFLDWRWNFFVNVPIGIALCVAIFILLPHESQEREHHDLDIPGAVLVTSGLVLFVYVASMAPKWGWLSSQSLGYGALALSLLGGFIVNEAWCRHPLMPLSIFTSRNVTGANLMAAPITAGAFGMFFLISLYVQGVLKYSPLMTGLCFLPFPLILGGLSQRMARGVTRFGFKPFLIIGPLIVASAVLWLIRLPVHGNYWIDVLPNVIIMPIGMAMTFMPLMVAATTGVPGDKAGLASGLINTSQQMGGALGLAVLSSVAATVTAHYAALGHSESIVYGYNMAFLVAVAFIMIATVLGAMIIRQPQKRVSADASTPAHAL
jgi:EmrB/QacA subfamily drug resistance transporter